MYSNYLKLTIRRVLASVGLAQAGQLKQLAEQVKRLEHHVVILRAAAETRNQRQAKTKAVYAERLRAAGAANARAADAEKMRREREKRRLETLRTRLEEAQRTAENAQRTATKVQRLCDVLMVNAEHREARYQPAALEFDRVAAHVSKAISAASMHANPVAHVVIESLFPEDTYRALLDAIPPDLCFTQRGRPKQNFTLSTGAVAPDFSVRVWSFIEQLVTPNVITPTLMQRFHSSVGDAYAARYGDLGPRVAALPHQASTGRLMLRRPGYHLDPHFDPKRVTVTFLLYLARAGDSDAFGTQFFLVTNRPQVDRTNTFFPGHHGYECKFEKTVPFKPNTAVAFLNFASGAHGADIPATTPETTKRYSYQFYISPEPVPLAALTGLEGTGEDQA